MEALFLAYNRRLQETDCTFQRFLYNKIDWNERLIGIKGARGVGKSTMILQHIKMAFSDTTKAFYASLDHIWFANHTLSELVEYLYTHGVNHIYLDEVHRYYGWIREIKNIYDSYPQIHMVFTGSSLLEINNAEADLSRRLRIYSLPGMSFREFVAINKIADLPVFDINRIIGEHVQIASSITANLKVLPYFEKYIQQGYYPFFLETNSAESYFDRLQQVVNTVIENDIPAVEDVEYGTLMKAKKLLMTLAQMVPFMPNMTTLCDVLSTTRNQLIRILFLLERSALIRQLTAETKNLKALGKPDKILFNNPNLMFALKRSADKGSVRESFFSSMLSVNHNIRYPRQGDLLVDERILFEIGGKNKGFSQIRDIPYSYVAADEIEIGFGNKIPLWLFGLLY